MGWCLLHQVGRALYPQCEHGPGPGHRAPHLGRPPLLAQGSQQPRLQAGPGLNMITHCLFESFVNTSFIKLVYCIPRPLICPLTLEDHDKDWQSVLAVPLPAGRGRVAPIWRCQRNFAEHNIQRRRLPLNIVSPHENGTFVCKTFNDFFSKILKRTLNIFVDECHNL